MSVTTPNITRTLGIRFARAQRFAAPVAVPFEPDQVLGHYGPLSPQVPGMMESSLGITAADMDEDCLFLNVFAPDTVNSDSTLPVLFWIHGGAYTNGGGSIPWYEGSALAARGHVVVTINYRLGAFGFLGESNCGTLDQICALKWVQSNIAAFGGNPANVTIFGESAGGSAVITLMSSPEAKGLFHRAWAMSPSINQVRNQSSAVEWQKAFLEAAGVSSIEDAKALSVDDVLAAQQKVLLMTSKNFDMFTPTAGGEALPVDWLEAAAHSPIPFCIGTNKDENCLWTAFDPTLATAGEDTWTKILATQFGDKAQEAKALYESIRPGATVSHLVASVQTDHSFRQPAQRLSERRAQLQTPAWMYWFTWESSAFGGALHSCHAIDIPFIFDNLDANGVEMMLGDGPERQEIADRLADELSSHSKHGHPSWEQFNLNSRPTLKVDSSIELIPDPEGAVRSLFGR